MDWTEDLGRVDAVAGSVTEPDAWLEEPILEGLRGIFHLAALVRHSRRGSEELDRTNVEGTLHMVRCAAARRCRIILASTSGTVGCFRSPHRTADEDSPYCEDEVAAWPYYRSKILAEKGARRLAEELGVELVIVRPPVLLGPGDHRLRSSGHLVRYLRGRLPFVVRGGMHFADVRDVAGALVRAMERSQVRLIYHLPGTVCSVQEFFELAEEVSGARAPRFVLPFRAAWWLATVCRPLRVLPDPVVIEMASRYWSMRSRYAGEDLEYQSRPGRETLADTVAWLRQNHPSLGCGTARPGRGAP